MSLRPPQMPRHLGLLTALVCFGATVADAQVCASGETAVISQLQDYQNGFKSDATSNPQIVAEQVLVAQATTLNSVTVWGGFGPGNSPTNDFTLVIHEDASGLPGNVIYTESGVATALTTTGVIFPPPLVPLTEYQATLTPAATVALPAGVLWFEVYSDGAGGDAWFWLTGTLDPQSGVPAAAISFTAPGVTWSTLNPDMAMVVCTSGGGQSNTQCFGDGSGAACPCGNEAANAGGCENSSGVGGMLTSAGSGSISSGDTTLHGTDLLPNQPALFFQGDQSINGGAGVVFGDGLRCCGQDVVRLEVAVPDAGGAASTSVDIAVKGGVSAGETKCYQLWYRDPSGGPCGAGFNLTNSAVITWTS